jgi:hypothetical protein
MDILYSIVKPINNAQIASAATYPTSPYTGSLPKKTVRSGNKGSDVKAVQGFLNWCMKAGLKKDGICGKKTVSAIKKYQKRYKLKADGIFGPKCKAKAKEIIVKYQPKPTPKPAPAPKPKAWYENANAWAKKIAADNSYHYMKWSNDSRTHECPICHNHPKGKFHGWNCIGFAFAIWHHGGKLNNKCNCHVIATNIAEDMYKAKNNTQALAIAQNRVGLKNIKVIRNKKGIPKSEWKPGDICIQFSGSKCVHFFYYMGDKKIADSCGSNGKVPNDKQIAVRSYDKYSAKIIIRYMGN